MRIIAINNPIPFHVVQYNDKQDEELKVKLDDVMEDVGELLARSEVAAATDVKSLFFKHKISPSVIPAALFMSIHGRSHVFRFIKELSNILSGYMSNIEARGHLVMSHIADSDSAIFERASGFSVESDKVVIPEKTIQGSLFMSDSTHSKASDNEMRNTSRALHSAFDRAEGYARIVMHVSKTASKASNLQVTSHMERIAKKMNPSVSTADLSHKEVFGDLESFLQIAELSGIERINELIAHDFSTELFADVKRAAAEYVRALAAVEDPASTPISLDEDTNITKPYHLVSFDNNNQFITSDLRPIYVNGIVLMASPYVQAAYEKFNLLTFFITKQIVEYTLETAEFWAALANKFPDSEIGRISTYLQKHVKLKQNEMFNFISKYSVSETGKHICTGLDGPFKVYRKGVRGARPMNVPISSGVHSITGRAQSGKDLLVAAIMACLLGKPYVRKDGTSFVISNENMLIIDMMERSSQANSEIKPKRVRSDNLETLIDLLSNRDEEIIFINSVTNLIDTLGIGDTTSTGIRQTAYDSVVSALNTFGEATGKVIFILTRGNEKQIPYMTQILSGASWTVFTLGPKGQDEDDEVFEIISRENMASSDSMILQKATLIKHLGPYEARDEDSLDSELDFLLD